MTHKEWADQYNRLKAQADRIHASMMERAREACAMAGLDAELLGIHPHNAIVAYESGKPWEGIDYHYVRLCRNLQGKSWEPYRILERWSQRTFSLVQWGNH